MRNREALLLFVSAFGSPELKDGVMLGHITVLPHLGETNVQRVVREAYNEIMYQEKEERKNERA